MFIVPVSVSRRASPRAHGFDRLFDDAFDRLFSRPLADSAPARRPAIDVAESDGGYVVTLDVPGVAREDVKVSIDGRRVSIVAEARAAETAPEATADQGPDKPAERTIVQERAAARFARSFVLQSEIDQSASQARLDNGVLTLTLAKRHASATQLAVD
ncbi:MAG: Hsp20/alpha crystallin family protein [Burkholderiaceae bacterium]